MAYIRSWLKKNINKCKKSLVLLKQYKIVKHFCNFDYKKQI